MKSPETNHLPPVVARDLARLVESEDLGEAFFGAAVRTCAARERDTWDALHALETKTRDGVRRFIERSGVDVRSIAPLAGTVGAFGGQALGRLPTHLALRAIKLGTRRYLPSFQRLAGFYAATPDAPFFDFVVDHELAIIACADATLAGVADALAPVVRLLDEPADQRLITPRFTNA